MRAASRAEDGVIDALILSEPSCIGPHRQRDGKPRQGYKQRQLMMLQENLSNVSAKRVVFAIFSDSEWFPEVTDRDIGAAFEPYANPVLRLVNPAQYRGHGAAGSWRFSVEYSRCIHEFLLGQIDAIEQCQSVNPDPSDPRNWYTLSHLPDSAVPISGNELQQMSESGAICAYDILEQRVPEGAGCVKFYGQKRIVTVSGRYRQFSVSNHAPVEYTDDGYCKYDGFSAQTTNRSCLRTFTYRDLMVFYSEGGKRLWWEQWLPGAELPDTDFHCYSGTKEFHCRRDHQED